MLVLETLKEQYYTSFTALSILGHFKVLISQILSPVNFNCGPFGGTKAFVIFALCLEMLILTIFKEQCYASFTALSI
jgi:hypothetical protein